MYIKPTGSNARGIQDLGVIRLAQRVAEPFQPFVKTISRGGAGGLDILVPGQSERVPLVERTTYPSPLPQAVQAKLIGDLGRIHGILRKMLTTNPYQTP